jgi:hypothetical protein
MEYVGAREALHGWLLSGDPASCGFVHEVIDWAELKLRRYSRHDLVTRRVRNGELHFEHALKEEH